MLLIFTASQLMCFPQMCLFSIIKTQEFLGYMQYILLYYWQDYVWREAENKICITILQYICYGRFCN